MEKKSFRTDINGLRAVAVLAVLFYHFNIPGFGGGYVGVDVFFVISGYLMTQIIAAKLSKGQFSILGFFGARARRILPALAALVLFILLVGFFAMPPTDYKLICRQVYAALLFVSNVFFSHKVDYFDEFSRQRMFLHTWSLSVEWQFYLALPVAMMALQKFKKARHLKTGIAALFFLSLAIGLVQTKLEPVAAFFLLPARGWELLAGSLVFFYGARISKIPYLAETGLACIFAAVCFYTSKLAFPGYWALLPVAGTAFVIAAGKESPLFGNKPAQFLGNISYSLYLWHWPLMVAANYYDIPAPAPLLLAASILMAWLSYTFVEEPFRHGKKITTRRRLLWGSLAGYGVLWAAVFGIFSFNGLPGRVPADVRAAEMENRRMELKTSACEFDYTEIKGVPECLIGEKRVPPSVVIWGDSHANAASLGLLDALKNVNRSALLYSYRGCPPVLGAIFPTRSEKGLCGALLQATYDKFMADPDIKDLFLIARWPAYLHGYNEKASEHPFVVFDENTAATEDTLPERSKQYAAKITETLCGLRRTGKNVTVVMTFPEMGRSIPSVLAKERMIYRRDAEINIPRVEYDRRSAEVLAAFKAAEKQCGVHILHPEEALCDASSCYGVKKSLPLYLDDNHISEFGNDLIRPMYFRALRQR